MRALDVLRTLSPRVGNAESLSDSAVSVYQFRSSGYRPWLNGIGDSQRESHRLRGQVQHADYRSSTRVKVKVLDFVKRGGPKWTVDGTIFEMWLGAPTKARSLTGA